MLKFINKMKNKKGFTLVELIIVLAVLGIIAAIAVPKFMGVQSQAKVDADKATAEVIQNAAELALASGADHNNIDIDYLVDNGYLDAKPIHQSSGKFDLNVTTTGAACSY